MKLSNWIKNLIFLFFTALIFSCNVLSSQEVIKDSKTTVICWNLQTFFDSVTDGTEYDEFKGKKSTWTTEKYQERINVLCDFIETQDADIYAFVELENADILQDISNKLASKSIKGGKYKYACFGKNQGGVFGCGVISKYPLENVKLHNIDFRIDKNQPELRPILEVTAYTKWEKSFSLFVCHWKSKSGGEKETDIWRDLQESLLSSCVSKADKEHIVVCGDFNRDLDEFLINERKDKIVFRNFDFSSVMLNESKLGLSEASFDQLYSKNCLSQEFFNPWLFSTEKGSYNYNNEWNKIDHFFLSDNISFLNFKTITEYTNEKGYPIKYSVSTGRGYSDHLPIMCQISF